MMFAVRNRVAATLLTVLALLMGVGPALADPGKPVAVRWWGQAMVSIEVAKAESAKAPDFGATHLYQTEWPAA